MYPIHPVLSLKQNCSQKSVKRDKNFIYFGARNVSAYIHNYEWFGLAVHENAFTLIQKIKNGRHFHENRWYKSDFNQRFSIITPDSQIPESGGEGDGVARMAGMAAAIPITRSGCELWLNTPEIGLLGSNPGRVGCLSMRLFIGAYIHGVLFKGL